MISIYKTQEQDLHQITEYSEDIWISVTEPTDDEIESLSVRYKLENGHLRAAMDNDESARIEVEDNYTLIIIDIPVTERRSQRNEYTTIPLSIIICEHAIITVCARQTDIVNEFIQKKVKEFTTKKRMKFLYQLLYRVAVKYQNDLRAIDKKRMEIEGHISNVTEDYELIQLHELESNLVYFATSLRANGLILERLSRTTKIKQYPEDRELLEDVIIENMQAIEMTQIYRGIINGTRELLSTVINNRLNNVMKYLASITIVMAIPTIISGLYGMNVLGSGMPFADEPYGFTIICVGIIALCALVVIVLKKIKML